VRPQVRFTLFFLLIVLSAGRPYAVDPHPTTKDLTSSTLQPKIWSPEAQRQQRIDYAEASDEVTALLGSGGLRAAEAAALKWEPEFGDLYGTGDFGFRMRLRRGLSSKRTWTGDSGASAKFTYKKGCASPWHFTMTIRVHPSVARVISKVYYYVQGVQGQWRRKRFGKTIALQLREYLKGASKT